MHKIQNGNNIKIFGPRTKIECIKVMQIFSFILITYSLWVLHKSTIIGYEPSIYVSTPIIVWVTIFIVTVFSVPLIIYLLNEFKRENHRYIYVSFLLLILVRILILTIPYIRGYVGWNADHLSHIGLIKDIIYYGNIDKSNVYPVIHIFSAEVSLITGTWSLKFISYLTILISILYVFGIYILSKRIIDDKKYNLIVLLVTIIVLFDRYNVDLIPNGWSILLMPLLLYAHFGVKAEFRFLTLILILLYAYIHPISSLFVILSFMTMYGCEILCNQRTNEKKTSRHPFNLISILFIMFVPWILSFSAFQRRLNSLVGSFTDSSIASNAILDAIKTANRIDINGFELIKLILKSMGDDLIYLIISFMVLLYTIYKMRSTKLCPLNLTFTKIVSIYAIIIMLYLLNLFNILPFLSYFQVGRLLMYHQIITPLIVAYFFLNMVKIKNKKYITIFLSIIIITSSTISVYSLYDSPHTKKPNSGVKAADIGGVTWLLEKKAPNINNARMLVRPDRYSQAIIGIRNAQNILITRGEYLPDHFNYTNTKYMGANFDSDKYFINFELERNAYTTIWKNANRFNASDFELLDNDSTVGKIYTNDNCIIHYVRSFNGTLQE